MLIPFFFRLFSKKRVPISCLRFSRKSVYFVPMVQDDPSGKPHSMVADFSRVCETLSDALAGVQVRKLIW